MKSWLSREAAIITCFYLVVGAITVVCGAVILRIWDLIEADLLGRIVATLVTVVGGVIFAIVANLSATAIYANEAKPETPTDERKLADWQSTLRRAKPEAAPESD